jgi:protein gp37
MADNSKIEWCDASWNPIRAQRTSDGRMGHFCIHASEGCRNCYAEAINHRLGTGIDFKAQNRNEVEIVVPDKALMEPLKWKRPRKIFVCSMSDLFGDFVPDEAIVRVLAVAAYCRHHTFIILTKRANRMRAYLSAHNTRHEVWQAMYKMNLTPAWWYGGAVPGNWPLPNVWFGVSAEDQANADERVPELLNTPAAVRFVSLEPLLGPIHLGYLGWPNGQRLRRTGYNALIGARYHAGSMVEKLPKLDWVIVGGESGPKARPMDPNWVRQLREGCLHTGIPFFFKQWGEWLPGEVYAIGDEGGFARHQDGTEGGHGGKHDHWWSGDSFGGVISTRVGKHAAGRRLDGIEHNEFPKVAA